MAFFRGELDEVEQSRSWSVDACEIINLEEAEFQIDGEMMNHPKTVSATIRKHAFKFLTGKSFKACQTSLD